MHNDGDPVAYLAKAAANADLVNARFDGARDAFGHGVIANLYEEESWPRLWAGLAALADDDDPTILVEAATEIRQFNEDGLLAHLQCLDSWLFYGPPYASVEEMIAEERQTDDFLAGRFPLNELLDFDVAWACPAYESIAPSRFEGALDGGDAPVLVVGNRSDFVTPLDESAELAGETLSNGYLIETDHDTHTVYPANSCVNELVDRVLIHARYPEDRTTTCAREVFAPDELFGMCYFELAERFGTLDELAANEVCDRFEDVATEAIGDPSDPQLEKILDAAVASYGE
jgi:hypothetical protein